MSREAVINALLEAALPKVELEGWRDHVFTEAIESAGIDRIRAYAACPQRCVDLALEFHRRGDRQMVGQLQNEDLESIKFSKRVALAVKLRIRSVADHRGVVRKGMALFVHSAHSHRGAKAVWDTADCIWNTLGDKSDDFNWYSKRAILSGVIGSSFLYWLSDQSENFEATSNFVDRRIADVMRIEETKRKLRQNPLSGFVMRGVDNFAKVVRIPPDPRNLPGWVSWRR